MLDQGKLGGLAGADQRAFGNQCAADAARDGRGHVGVARIDLCDLYGRAVGRHVGLGLLLRGDHVDIFLLADGVRFHQRLVALRLRRGLGQVGLRLAECCLGAGKRRLVGRRIDLVQHLAGLDFAAFCEQALEHHAVDAGAHLGHADRFHPAGQLGLERDGREPDRDDADFRRRAIAAPRRGGIFAAACRKHVKGNQGEGGVPDHGVGPINTHLRKLWNILT